MGSVTHTASMPSLCDISSMVDLLHSHTTLKCFHADAQVDIVIRVISDTFMVKHSVESLNVFKCLLLHNTNVHIYQ